jgi:hypothetical protein
VTEPWATFCIPTVLRLLGDSVHGSAGDAAADLSVISSSQGYDLADIGRRVTF